jgi:site-specific DNA recombinase
MSRWDILVAAKMDRISRSVSDLCNLIKYAEVHGKYLASVAEQFDLSTPAGRMVAHILASVAEFERERTGERRREATEALHKAGRWSGGRFPYGYTAKKNGHGWQLVPDPEAAPVVQWMAEQVISGRAATAVARDLNERGVPTAAGGRDWRTETVIGNLRNPGLTGQVIWKGEPVRDADGEIVRHEGILDDATFAALQAALDAGKQRRNGRRQNASLLLRVAYCGRCQEPLYRSMRKRGSRVYHYYACAARLASGGRKCEEPYFGVEALEQFVSGIVLDYCGDVPRRVKEITPAEDHSAELASVTEAISAMQTKLIESKVSPELFADTVSKLEARKAALEAKLSRPERVDWVPTGETFGEWWQGLDEDGRHRYLIEAGVMVNAKHLDRGQERIVPSGTFERKGHRVIAGSRKLGFLATMNLGELEVLRDLAGRHGAPSEA